MSFKPGIRVTGDKGFDVNGWKWYMATEQRAGSYISLSGEHREFWYRVTRGKRHRGSSRIIWRTMASALTTLLWYACITPYIEAWCNANPEQPSDNLLAEIDSSGYALAIFNRSIPVVSDYAFAGATSRLSVRPIKDTKFQFVWFRMEACVVE